jgi:hypothetical protein
MTVADLIKMLQRVDQNARVVITVDHGAGTVNMVSDVAESVGAATYKSSRGNNAAVVLSPLSDEMTELQVTWTHHKDLMKFDYIKNECEVCGGTGIYEGEPCEDCDGKGRL